MDEDTHWIHGKAQGRGKELRQTEQNLDLVMNYVNEPNKYLDFECQETHWKK